MEDFGTKLIKIRRQRNVSQEQLADLLHVSRGSVSKWEKGNGSPTLDMLKTICSELDVKEEYFISDEDEAQTPQASEAAEKAIAAPEVAVTETAETEEKKTEKKPLSLQSVLLIAIMAILGGAALFVIVVCIWIYVATPKDGDYEKSVMLFSLTTEDKAGLVMAAAIIVLALVGLTIGYIVVRNKNSAK